MSRVEIRTTTKHTVMDWHTFCLLPASTIMEFVADTGKRRAAEIQLHRQPVPRSVKYTPFRVVGR